MLNFWINLNLQVLMSLFLLGGVVLAQGQGIDCPAIVQAALDATAEHCSATGRNQACYGNVNLDAIPQPGISDFHFNMPGDIVTVNAISSLSLSSEIEEAGVWGVALMSLQANLPDALPGQNVTFLLFGDVQIQNAVEDSDEPVTMEVTAQGNIDVYRRPSANEASVATVSDGDTLTAIGRNAGNTWLHVSLEDMPVALKDMNGWVLAQEVAADGDIAALELVDPAGIPFAPMQAFYLQTGIGIPACVEVPESGVLVQTMEGVGQIQFTVNDVNFTLGSTAYFQAQPHGEMTVSVIEGAAQMEANGVSVNVPAGSQVRVPLDDEGHAFAPPSEPEPYDAAKLAALPLRILPRTVTTAAPISAEQLQEALVTGDTSSATVIVLSNQADWVDTGITLSAGQTFTVEAHGRMNPCLDIYPDGEPYCVFFSPHGPPFVVTSNNEYGVFPGLGLRFMALLGRIGDGDPFYIGAGGTFTAAQAGALRLTPNDNTRTDNQGAYRVWIWPDSPSGG